VEIRNHWRRDAVWGEDRSRTRNPNALANLALLRSALLARLARHPDERSLPALLESFADNPASAFTLINTL
jgi:predicted transposase YbfD/YdcC